MEPKKIYLTTRKFAEEHSRKGWPTWNALRNMHCRRRELQFETAFIKLGRRVLVDYDEFWACVERKEKRDRED